MAAVGTQTGLSGTPTWEIAQLFPNQGEWTEAEYLALTGISEDDPDRDLVAKRAEYARAGIREYWIVDPRDQTIVVLSLDAAASADSVAGHYASGEAARSVLLDGFSVDVAAVFSQP
jgi:hypothetical protein